MTLVDTNVLSEIRRPQGSTRVKEAFLSLGNDVRLSAIVLGEIRFGIGLQHDAARRAQLAAWYAGIARSFERHVLPVTLEIAERWGDLAAGLQRTGRRIDVLDGLIAATALVHDLTLWTRYPRDFDGTGVRLLNPWET